MEQVDSVSAPESEKPEASRAHTYAQLCAQIGERHYLIAKLSAEIAELSKRVDAIQAESPEPTA